MFVQRWLVCVKSFIKGYKKINKGEHVGLNAILAPSLAAVSMLDCFFFFLPFKLHKDVIIEGFKTWVQCKKKYQSGNFRKWHVECLFLYLGNTGVWNVPRIAPCLFIKSLLNDTRLFLWMNTQYYMLPHAILVINCSAGHLKKLLSTIFLYALMTNYKCNLTNSLDSHTGKLVSNRCNQQQDFWAETWLC